MLGILAPALLEIGGKIFDQVFPDQKQAQEAKLKLMQLQQDGQLKQLESETQLMLAQSEINKADAKSASNFRGGWRPFIGWVCGCGLAYQFLVRPLANGTLVALGYCNPTPELDTSVAVGYCSPMPELDTSTLMALITGMLGFGSLRTFEKSKGMK